MNRDEEGKTLHKSKSQLLGDLPQRLVRLKTVPYGMGIPGVQTGMLSPFLIMIRSKDSEMEIIFLIWAKIWGTMWAITCHCYQFDCVVIWNPSTLNSYAKFRFLIKLIFKQIFKLLSIHSLNFCYAYDRACHGRYRWDDPWCFRCEKARARFHLDSPITATVAKIFSRSRSTN